MYPGLCHGAGKLVEVFGTEKQRERFLTKMYTGQWGGSMLLTEPGAGSDVGGLDDTACAAKLAKNKNTVFYDGQIKTARYFIRTLLPEALGRMDAIAAVDDAVIEMADAAF